MAEPTETEREQMMDLAAMAAEELLPVLVPWTEDGAFGKMLRHPLVYQVPMMLPGMANRAYKAKCAALDEAIAEQNWHRVVFLHERPHRLNALIEYVIGRDEEGEIVSLVDVPKYWDLAADVWVDSENIGQHEDDWRDLLDDTLYGEPRGLWLGTTEERAAFDALPDPIPAWRGGVVGDWSWTTDHKIAQFFARRSGYKVRRRMIPKADCFGYFTRRGESELLVRLTPDREPLVYPDRFPETGA